jgi:hypothetical protein
LHGLSTTREDVAQKVRGYNVNYQTLRYVPYDSAPMAALARARGMHAWASAIATGWVERTESA